MLEWIAAALSPEQQDPLKRSTANACILASAGSGKTRTLVHLLAADLAAGIPANSIIAFTFTQKAAAELLARVHMLIKTYLPNINLSGMFIGTIHAWCLQYLVSQSDFYNYTPIDELQVDALVSRLHDALDLAQAYGQPYPKAIGKFLSDIEIFYNEHLALEQVPLSIRPNISRFLDTLHGNRLITYGGMVRYATMHLLENGPLPGLHSLYIDEYQDVNPGQVALVKAMLPSSGKVVAVGDDLQCIYQWRGSDVTRIINFSQEFGEVTVCRLNTNYRSRPPIVVLSNRVAENVSFRDPSKFMLPARNPLNHRMIHWLSLDTEEEQAQAVVDIVKNFQSQQVPLNRIAVLVRSVTGSGKPIVDALNINGITVQCPILSRGGSFISQFLLPVFDWLRNKHNEPHNEIEEREAIVAANNLWASVRDWVNPDSSDAENSFWVGLNEWLDLIEKQRNEAYNVRSQLYDFMNKCNIRIRPNDYNLMVGVGIASQIIRSVEEIHRRRILGQERRTPKGVMSEVYFALGRNHLEFGESVPIDTTTEGVVITTIHQAKGLEWPIVIIPMLVKGRFPVRSRRHATSFPDEIAARYGTSADDERRLFYVAVTRARERLFLLDPANSNNKARSLFTSELYQQGAIDVTSLSQVEESAWQLDQEDLEAGDPPPLRIGLSDLLLYVECPYQFALRRVVAVQPSVGDELGFGRGLHELIQRRLEANEEWSAEDLNNHINNYIRLPYMSAESENQSRRAIAKRITSLDKIGAFENRTEPETRVEVLLNGGIVHGIIDNVQVNDDGSVLVRDWKSNIHASFLPRYERQVQFYAYALEQQGRNVTMADMVDVAASDHQGRLVTRQVDTRPETIGQLVQTLEGCLSGIVAGRFAATPSAISCSCCDMYRLCSERIKNDTTEQS